MAKFNFKYESILNLKKQVENQEQMELANRMKILDQEKLKLDMIAAEEQKFVNDFYAKNGQAVAAKLLIELNKTIKYYGDQKREQKKTVELAKEHIIQQRDVLKLAVIERKAYEKLKERAMEVHIEEEKVEENRLVDDIVSYNYSKA